MAFHTAHGDDINLVPSLDEQTFIKPKDLLAAIGKPKGQNRRNDSGNKVDMVWQNAESAIGCDRRVRRMDT